MMETARDLLLAKEQKDPAQFLVDVFEENTASAKNLAKMNKHGSSTRIKTLNHTRTSSRVGKIERRMKSLGTINKTAIVSPFKFSRMTVHTPAKEL